MSKRLTYSKFQTLPVKYRWHIVEKALEINGYSFTTDRNKRERQVRRALAEFQRNNGLSGNNNICETTFELLNLSEIEVS